ncbi:MAG TPA: phosphatidylglycerophosphatase A [Syntrophales bacterium]|nr:phosphatidylglycerophosphatase A [Syntrophales bacterium]
MPFLFDRLIKFLATGFCSGLVPFAPGTAGTIAGIPIYLAFSRTSWTVYFVFAVAFTCLACYVSDKAERIFGEKDASYIVIDEMAGFQWTMFLIAPTVLHVFIGFILFRLFDILKIFPAGYFHRRLPGGYGVVIDDVVAGMYANITFLLTTKFWGI